jgi:hypothetical protein
MKVENHDTTKLGNQHENVLKTENNNPKGVAHNHNRY